MRLFGLKLNSLLVIAVAALLALGAISAFADHAPDHPGDGVTVDDDDVSVQAGEDGEGAGQVAEVIATSFDADEGDVTALHEAGFGFGAIFKLYLLAAAGDETAADILASGEKGEGGFAFGKLFKESADEVSALTAGEDGMPKNLGQAMSGSKNGDGVATAEADGDGDEDEGDGPPDHAPAHGRNKD